MASFQLQVDLPEGADSMQVTLIQNDGAVRNVVTLSNHQFESAAKLVHAVVGYHDEPLANLADEFLFNIP